ncbi:MAG: hypothetical protein UT22_C0036G0002 [Parcubacteria group bacterium GW2011_GWC2_39_11]|nr:MAG: hypothetical protein UT22_C0036G0002 [Parcubacteria group bacterium GW2011_GWC2_39_11]
MSTTFKRVIEDFTCGHCGVLVKGNGYTSHCPKCLWSKHVDNNPGDRAATCHGLMSPVGVEQEGQEYKLLHRCAKCGIVKRNKVVPEDDFDEVLKVAKAKA